MLSELDKELSLLESAGDSELQAEVSSLLEGVSLSQDAFAPLPTQGAQSLELHSAIVSHYKHRAAKGKGSKADFMRRKERRKLERKQKKGSEYRDKQEPKRKGRTQR
jgi:hypothetical protein